jgi:hypothetical protein
LSNESGGNSVPTLTLDPRSIIMPMETGLRIYSTQGTVELRSKNLARVHEIFLDRLAGQYTERALISAVPSAQKMTVRTYLRALRDAGAIQFGKNGIALRFKQQAVKAAQPRSLTKPPKVDDEAQLQGDKQVSLQYVTGREFASLLVRKVATGFPAKRQIYVLTDESRIVEPNSDNCDWRAPYSKWLLSREYSYSCKPKIEVFQIDKNTGGLTRRATLAGKGLAVNREVPNALELVRATDVEQAPLAVCHADSMLCYMEVRRFGVDYDRVADEMLRDMLTRMMCESPDEVRRIEWRRIPIAKETASEPALPPVMRDNCIVSASLGELRLQLLERFMARTQRMSAQEERCNLLQSWHSPDLDYLSRVLRQRHSYLEAQITIRVDGLYQCTHGDLSTASLLRQKALRDLMILLTWRTYYGCRDDAAYKLAHECDYSFAANPAQLKKVLTSATKRQSAEIANMYAVFAKLSCWGKNAWVGMLEE